MGRIRSQKDGGIDFIAYPRDSHIPFLLAVQAKHKAGSGNSVEPKPVRELLAAVNLHRLNAGLLVTSTMFTPDARWVAEQAPILMRLRDGEDLQRWLRDEFLQEERWRDLPDEIEVCPGIRVKLGQ